MKAILPGGCCGNCRAIVSDQVNADKHNLEPKSQFPRSKKDYQEIIKVLQKLPPSTRQNPDCACFICKTS